MCKRLSGKRHSEVSFTDVTLLVTTCTAALSSSGVGHALCHAVLSMCSVMGSQAKANAVTCGAAGVIPAIVAAIRAHGAAIEVVARVGCAALNSLAWFGNTVNADAIVLSTGGLDAILLMMTVHARDSEVQLYACQSLCWIAAAASPAAKRVMCEPEGSVRKLLRTAKSNHPANAELESWADSALARVRNP